MLISYQDVLSAQKRIKDYIYTTPLEKSNFLSKDTTECFLKLESLQKSVKSFKLRGALSKLTTMTREEKNRGVTAISSGNHGVALAYASKLLGVDKVEIFCPETTPLPKVEKIQYYGAHINKVGVNYDETHEVAEKLIKENGLMDVNACEDPIAVAGQGTVGLEILEQNPDIDVILVPIGGGGLITGIGIAAKGIKPSIEVIGVQPEASPAMAASIRDNVCYEYFNAAPSVCDALIGGIGRLPFFMKDQCIDDVLIVKEESIKKATASMMKNEKIIAEPSSAICYAAVVDNDERFQGKKVALIISGGNISDTLMREFINQYL